MFLQILIPQYKEDERIIGKLLDSIELQRNIDFKDIGVIIVNDGSDIILKNSFLNEYPFKIDYIRNEHKGVSATRNRALKEATADYVMFCDADDMFFHCLGIQLILREVKEKHPLCFYSTFLEEVPDEKDKTKNLYNARSNAFVFVHGKVYNRQFLIDNNIYWDDELIYHEDGYFNGLALGHMKTTDIVYCNEPFYLWCNNPESISKKNPLFILDTYDHNLVAQDRLIHKLLPVNILEATRLTAIQLFQTYFILTGLFKTTVDSQEQNINQNIKEHIKERLTTVDKMLADFYLEFKDCYKHVPEEARKQLFESVKNGIGSVNDKNATLDDFYPWLIEFKKEHNIEFDDSPIELPKKEEPATDTSNIREVEVIEKQPNEELKKK